MRYEYPWSKNHTYITIDEFEVYEIPHPDWMDDYYTHSQGLWLPEPMAIGSYLWYELDGAERISNREKVVSFIKWRGWDWLLVDMDTPLDFPYLDEWLIGPNEEAFRTLIPLALAWNEANWPK